MAATKFMYIISYLRGEGSHEADYAANILEMAAANGALSVEFVNHVCERFGIIIKEAA